MFPVLSKATKMQGRRSSVALRAASTRSVLITGSTSGIGLSIAKALAGGASFLTHLTVQRRRNECRPKWLR